jgi:hypothetical protein
MLKYDKYRYIYPPRPKNAISSSDLDYWDNNSLIAQPKLNGTNCTIYINGVKMIVMNRHGQKLTNFQIDQSEIMDLYRGSGWMVINGEYLNKNKKDETGDSFNHKLVIFDLLVIDNDYLVGRTFSERIDILDYLYGNISCDKDYLWRITENIYRVKSYEGDFLNLYNEFIKIDMIEGLVLKRKNAKLEIGNTENNNVRTQLKARKPTKSYKY